MIPGRTAVLVIGAVMLQLHLFSSFTFDGARPDVVLLLVLAAGAAGGSDRGAIVGFAAGLLFDVFLATPLGLTALVYTAAGHLMGRAAASLEDVPWWMASLLVAAGSAVTMFAYALFGELLGLDTLHGPPLISIVLVVALVNLVFAPLVLPLIRWASTGDRTRRRNSMFA